MKNLIKLNSEKFCRQYLKRKAPKVKIKPNRFLRRKIFSFFIDRK